MFLRSVRIPNHTLQRRLVRAYGLSGYIVFQLNSWSSKMSLRAAAAAAANGDIQTSYVALLVTFEVRILKLVLKRGT